MSELRKDPIVGRWVIISAERGQRPSDFCSSDEVIHTGFCPFCEGNESKTPPEVMAIRDPGSKPNKPGWRLRVVPNKFPALRIEGSLDPRGEGMFDRMNGIGAHEVIIETPRHDEQLADMSVDRVTEVFMAFRDRIADLKGDRRFRFCMVFKNHGRSAGASLAHSHSQLIAMPIVPKRVGEELAGAQQYFRSKDRCIYCDIMNQEREDEVRVVMENEGAIALAPYAPRFPFETWILPTEHQASFEDASPEQIRQFAELTRELLQRMNQALEYPPYNFSLHTSPFPQQGNPFYHWHLELMPRLTRVAGFEWGTGFYINPTPPEEAARFLRQVRFPATVGTGS